MPVATRYRITRLDSLTLGGGAGARPQVNEKVAYVTVRSHPPSLVISLDSVLAKTGSRALDAAVDSVRGLR